MLEGLEVLSYISVFYLMESQVKHMLSIFRAQNCISNISLMIFLTNKIISQIDIFINTMHFLMHLKCKG